MGKANKAKTSRDTTDKKATAKAKRAPAAAKAGATTGNGSAESAARPKKIENKCYEKELFGLQVELVKMVEWIKHEGLKVVVIFEGRDAAGKGGVIKRINQHLSPRICRVVALPAPTEREQTQWYFQRYVPHLPAAGEMVPVRSKLVQPGPASSGSWLLHRRGTPRVPAHLPGVRAHARAVRHQAHQVLVLRLRRGAGEAVPEPAHPEPQTLEAQPDGSGIAAAVGRILPRRRTTCSRTPTSSRRRGTSSTRT